MVMAAVAVGGAVAGVAGASMTSSAAKDAASTQADAADRAAAQQNDQWQQTQANLRPYLQLGGTAVSPLLSALGYTAAQNGDGSYSMTGVDRNNPLQQTFSAPTADQAAATPGYQFTQQQGLKSVQNSAAARGLGTSGAAMKGAAGYATGLADSTYNDVYNRALTTFNTNYSSAANNANRLQGLVSNGQNAAATNGSLGAANSAATSNLLTGAANAQASGMVGSANAMASGLNGVGNSAMMYGMMQNNAAKTPAAGAQQSWAPSSSDAAI